jgi:hypothetical protein
MTYQDVASGLESSAILPVVRKIGAKTRIILYAAVLSGAAFSASAGALPNLDIQKIC